MLYDTYTQIAGVRKAQKWLIITAVIHADTQDPSYEFTDLDTGQEYEMSAARLRDYVRSGSLRRYDSVYVRQQYTDRYIPADGHELIIAWLREHGTFPHHLIQQRRAA